MSLWQECGMWNAGNGPSPPTTIKGTSVTSPTPSKVNTVQCTVNTMSSPASVNHLRNRTGVNTVGIAIPPVIVTCNTLVQNNTGIIRTINNNTVSPMFFTCVVINNWVTAGQSTSIVNTGLPAAVNVVINVGHRHQQLHHQ